MCRVTQGRPPEATMSTSPLPASPFDSSTPGNRAPQATAQHGSQSSQQQAAAGSASQVAPVPLALLLPPLLTCPNESVLCGEVSLAGSRYGKLNQDYVLTEHVRSSKQQRQRRMPQCCATVVLDGHGMLGEHAAQHAGRAIMHALHTSTLQHRTLSDLSQEDIEMLLHQAFAAGHKAALRVYDDAPNTYIFPLGSRYEERYSLQKHDTGDKVYCSPKVGARILEFGTSATLALVQGTTLVVADVGDSLAVLGWEAGDTYQAEIVSVRHWGWNEGEAARLARDCSGSVRVSPEDGYLCVEEGRMRGFQLAMTRALGHRLLSHHGVIAQPSVTFHQLRPEHVCLIVATDGVWEVIRPGQAVKLVADVMAVGRTAQDAANELCSLAVSLASGANTVRQSGGEADNTTASVLVFAEL